MQVVSKILLNFGLSIVVLLGLSGCSNSSLATTVASGEGSIELTSAISLEPGSTSTWASTPSSTQTPEPFSEIDVNMIPCVFDLCPSDVELSDALEFFGDDFEVSREGDIVLVEPGDMNFNFAGMEFTLSDEEVIQIQIIHPEYEDFMLTELPIWLGNPSEIRVASYRPPQGDFSLAELFIFWNERGLMALFQITSNQLTETGLRYCVEDEEFEPAFIYFWSPGHLDAPPVYEQDGNLIYQSHSLEDEWGLTIDEFIQDIATGNYCFDVPL